MKLRVCSPSPHLDLALPQFRLITLRQIAAGAFSRGRFKTQIEALLAPSAQDVRFAKYSPPFFLIYCHLTERVRACQSGLSRM